MTQHRFPFLSFLPVSRKRFDDAALEHAQTKSYNTRLLGDIAQLEQKNAVLQSQNESYADDLAKLRDEKARTEKELSRQNEIALGRADQVSHLNTQLAKFKAFPDRASLERRVHRLERARSKLKAGILDRVIEQVAEAMARHLADLAPKDEGFHTEVQINYQAYVANNITKATKRVSVVDTIELVEDEIVSHTFEIPALTLELDLESDVWDEPETEALDGFANPYVVTLDVDEKLSAAAPTAIGGSDPITDEAVDAMQNAAREKKQSTGDFMPDHMPDRTASNKIGKYFSGYTARAIRAAGFEDMVGLIAFYETSNSFSELDGIGPKTAAKINSVLEAL